MGGGGGELLAAGEGVRGEAEGGDGEGGEDAPSLRSTTHSSTAATRQRSSCPVTS